MSDTSFPRNGETATAYGVVGWTELLAMSETSPRLTFNYLSGMSPSLSRQVTLLGPVAPRFHPADFRPLRSDFSGTIYRSQLLCIAGRTSRRLWKCLTTLTRPEVKSK